MTLKSFNIFGMIIFTEQEIIITASALDEKKSIERTFKFPIEFGKKNNGTAIPFAAFVEKNKPHFYMTRRRSIDPQGKDSIAEFINTSDVENALKKTLDLMANAAHI